MLVEFNHPVVAIGPQTEKAVLIKMGPIDIISQRSVPEENKCWVPLKLVMMEQVDKDTVKVTLPDWIVEKKGLDKMVVINPSKKTSIIPNVILPVKESKQINVTVEPASLMEFAKEFKLIKDEN